MNKSDKVTMGKIMQHSNEWLTVAELAQRFGVHTDTIRRWATNGRIKCIRHPVNNYRLFLMDDLGNGTKNYYAK